MKRLALLIPLLAAAFAPAGEVEVRIEDRTYPVAPGKKRKGEPKAAKLAGKSEYTTRAVILENEFLRLTVLPELGGRIVRGVYKPTKGQLFWEFDKIIDSRSWSMGGCRWSFPFWEHGRHFDETAGYAVVKHDDGAVTLAMDMRFERFLKPAETRRYGRATNLRLVQSITLRPGRTGYEWSARVENPLPVRCGFKLWYLLRQPAVEGLRVILPAAATTGHGANDLKKWDSATAVGEMQDSRFAVGMRHDFAGWHSPKRNLNILRIQDHEEAPGAKVVLYRPRKGGYVETWGGNHEVFEECGRMLPALGAWEMKVTVMAIHGLGGPADFANEHAAATVRKVGGAWEICVVPTHDLARARVGTSQTTEDDGETRLAKGEDEDSRPAPAGKLLVRKFEAVADKITVTFSDGDEVLFEQTFPLDVGQEPTEAYKAVKRRVEGTMPGGKGLYAELTDLTSEHQFHLPRAAKMNEKILAESEDPDALLDAARRLMRVRSGSQAVRKGLEKVLAADSDNRFAHLYLAIWLGEQGKRDEAFEHLKRTGDHPGGLYLRALAFIRRGEPGEAVAALKTLNAAKPQHSFYGKDDPSRALMQPGARVAAAEELLLLAIAQRKAGEARAATATLKKLTARDPSCIEAWMLLGDKQKLATLTAANPTGRKAAEDKLTRLRAGTWAGIGRP